MKEIYFVRHGESNSNVDGIHRGAHASLTDKGIEQAAIVAERIHAIGVDALVSSPFARTLHTAEYISKKTGLPIEECELFRERKRPSELEGRNRDEADVRKVTDAMFKGYSIPNFRYADEENLDDLRARAIEALEFLVNHPASRICVVTHGIFLRTLLCAAVHGADFTGRELQHSMHSFDTDNTGIFYLQYRKNQWASENDNPMGWYVRSWNDLSHFG